MPLRGKWSAYFVGGTVVLLGALTFAVPAPAPAVQMGGPFFQLGYWFNGAWLILCGTVGVMIVRRAHRRDL